MNALDIDENILQRRFLNLEKAINKFIKQLQKNGLAKQLQYYRASSSFDASQYVDLFDEILTDQREHFLLTIHQEIDHENFLINQYNDKLRRRNQRCFNETKDLRSKNEKLREMFETFNNRLSSLKSSQETIEQTYIQKIETLQKSIELSSTVQYQQKKVLIPLCHQTTIDLHDDFINEIPLSISEILQAYRTRLKSQIKTRIQNAVFNDHNHYLNDIYKLKNEMDIIQAKNGDFSIAVKSLSNCISTLTGIEADDEQNITDQIPQIVEQLKKGIITQCLIESKKKFLESYSKSTNNKDKKPIISKLSTDAESFCNSIKETLEIAISKREKEYEKLETFARKKRLNLQKEYEKSINQLDKINAQRPDHTEIIDEMNISSISFIEKTKQLDENIKLLAKSPFISKSILKQNE